LWRLFSCLCVKNERWYLLDGTMTTLPYFDPRLVPVTGVDSHLSPVPAEALLPEALVHRFQSSQDWTPALVTEPRFVDREPVRAAVLIPLVMRERLMVLLTERTTNLSNHSGQIAFPGGKADAQDADASATALREAREEVGLASACVKVLGCLPDYTTGSAFVVTPVVGLVLPESAIAPNPHEVADVFEVPLDFLMNPAHHRHHAFEWQGQRRTWISMPYQDSQQERYIWGATAAMLRNLYHFLHG
jgi:8-oxo-dGTP pyrophosphatase MutT (NUDIX family)